jgi:hypothetical protein
VIPPLLIKGNFITETHDENKAGIIAYLIGLGIGTAAGAVIAIVIAFALIMSVILIGGFFFTVIASAVFAF